MQNMIQKPKGKTLDTYLKHFYSTVKTNYICECWGDAPKNDTFANEIEKFCSGILKLNTEFRSQQKDKLD